MNVGVYKATGNATEGLRVGNYARCYTQMLIEVRHRACFHSLLA